MNEFEALPLADGLQVLAVMGDLSMGQPTDHSIRVAWLAQRMAVVLEPERAQVEAAAKVALLRFVGCTANAPDVAQLLSDDVRGRAALLAGQRQAVGLLVTPEEAEKQRNGISATHCEVAGLIATSFRLDQVVVTALEATFEIWDGRGKPNGVKGNDVPMPVYLAQLAGDLDIFNREHGLAAALAYIHSRADMVYPRQIVDAILPFVGQWLVALAESPPTFKSLEELSHSDDIALSLVADAIDLKLPWLAGYSRSVASLVTRLSVQLGLPPADRRMVYRAALLHGLGRVSVPNAIWNRSGTLSVADWERVRLCPYWTARTGAQVRSLGAEAELASFAYERLDGSGYFRAMGHATLPIASRILQVATAYLALVAERPWRTRHTSTAAFTQLQQQAEAGQFDLRVVRALQGQPAGAAVDKYMPAPQLLSQRECDVLRLISKGHSNKETARRLALSPFTVRTHAESIFRKLDCKSRAAATLKASQLGLLGDE